MVRYNSENIDWDEIRARIVDQDNKKDMSTSADIDWEELRRKVENDSDKEMEECINNKENEDSIDYYCGECSLCDNKSKKDCIGLPTKDGSESYDFADEHGLIDDDGNMIETDDEYNDYVNEKDNLTDSEISSIAWNTKIKPVANGDFLGIQKPNMFYPKVDIDYTGMNKEIEKENALDVETQKELDAEYDDIECKHFLDESNGIGEVYIYPINENIRICLCKTCNANLASKMLEQLALETFI